MPQTKREIQSILLSAGLRPRKRFGQHFLIDGNLMLKLVDAAEIGPSSVVLEVGPGTGGLTELIAARAGAVVAVEVDLRLADILAQRFHDWPQIHLIRGDVLAGKYHLAPEVIEALTERRAALSAAPQPKTDPPELLLVANLPYQIASPLIMNLVTSPLGFSRLCFSVQREVAERICAAPRTKAYGPMSVVLQACCDIYEIARLPPDVFWPRPLVDSTMLRMDLNMVNFGGPQPLATFAAWIRQAFAHRRKTLGYNLRQIHDAAQVEQGAHQAGVDLQARPEALPVETWLELFEQFVTVEQE